MATKPTAAPARDPFEGLARHLDTLEAAGLLRSRSTRGPLHVVCSNDYLGLGAREVAVRAEAGAAASPLVSGWTDVHARAAEALSRWLRCEDVTLFTSGYAGNLGVLQALGMEGTVFVSDALNHASLIDGCRLSRARTEVVPHLDLDALERTLGRIRSAHVGPCWVVTESYFSMDGDAPDLAAVRSLCDRFEAGLVVDEAHALGVYGPEGRGLCAQADVVPDVLLGTLGKSFGLHGAFAAGRRVLQSVLWNRARSLVFSTAGSPLVLSLVPERAEEIAGGDELRRLLLARARRLRGALSRLVERTSGRVIGDGPIVPLVLGEVARTVALADRLVAAGYLVKPMRPPTVPEHASRLRFTATLSLPGPVFDGLEATLDELT